ncbi:hypothetical protein REPUB_Repub10bG0181200 [Reevesia pubescens]
MDYYQYPSRFSMSSFSLFGDFIEKVKDFCNFAVSAIIGNIFSAILTFFFALVGTLLGAMTGALIGQETESGFVRGAAVGAISGAVFSIEVFESSLVLWQSDESGIGCLLYLIDVIASLLSGRLVRERIGPAMLSAVQSQMGAAETSFEEVQNIFDTGCAKGLAGDLVEKIPKITITNNNNVDASGEKVSCSVCLQDFQPGETVRSLPQCHHMFHLPCIDKWLLSHGSCPLCRRDMFLEAEVRLLSTVNHPNLILYIWWGFVKNLVRPRGAKILVYEYVPHGSLLEYIMGRGGRNLTWKQRVNIAIGAAKAKVSDFGLVKLGHIGEQSHVNSQIKGTPGYLDPEYCTSFHLSPFSDVYSFDVILLQLVCTRPAVDSTRNQPYYHIIDWVRPCVGRGSIEEIIDIRHQDLPF